VSIGQAAMEHGRGRGVDAPVVDHAAGRAAIMEGEHMIRERKVAKEERPVRVKGVEAKRMEARREHKQPYATEVEDYTSDAVKAPEADPRRKKEHSASLGDAADRLRPLAPSPRRKAH